MLTIGPRMGEWSENIKIEDAWLFLPLKRILISKLFFYAKRHEVFALKTLTNTTNKQLLNQTKIHALESSPRWSHIQVDVVDTFIEGRTYFALELCGKVASSFPPRLWPQYAEASMPELAAETIEKRNHARNPGPWYYKARALPLS